MATVKTRFRSVLCDVALFTLYTIRIQYHYNSMSGIARVTNAQSADPLQRGRVDLRREHCGQQLLRELRPVRVHDCAGAAARGDQHGTARVPGTTVDSAGRVL